jgi:hypothetical protein
MGNTGEGPVWLDSIKNKKRLAALGVVWQLGSKYFECTETNEDAMHYWVWCVG